MILKYIFEELLTHILRNTILSPNLKYVFIDFNKHINLDPNFLPNKLYSNLNERIFLKHIRWNHRTF